jgi:hypothetical protein
MMGARRTSGKAAGSLVLTVLIAITAPASAQEPATASTAELLDEASAAIDEARFVDADVALDQAARGTLTREALLRWLGLRALLSFADGRLGALEEALQGYASLLAPDDVLPAAFPTPLRTRLAELRDADARIELTATPAVTATGDGRELAMPAEARLDPGHLVRGIEVWVSIDGAPELMLAASEHVSIAGDVHRDVELRYRLLGRGPGGAIVRLEGTEDEPLVALAPALPRGLDDGVIAAVVTVAVVAVAGAVVLGWGASENWWRGSETRVIGPLLSF